MRLLLPAVLLASVLPAAPAQAAAVQVVGKGTPASCTSQAVVNAVAKGGTIRFDCGPKPVTIKMTATAKVRNTSRDVVIDGGGKVTLSGMGKRRILYMNTCDRAQIWTTSHCQDQATPRLTIKNIGFADGNSTGRRAEGGGGGAVFVRGGRLSVSNAAFTRNRCEASGPDLGGAAIRVLDQYKDLPVTVRKSRFTNGACANGGALSSIGVSWVVVDSVFTGNRATGSGANPARSGKPGGGSGGALYMDGNRFTVKISGSTIQNNRANEGGGAIFFVSNDNTGTLHITRSRLRDNPSLGFETAGFPGIFFKGNGKPHVTP